jgi:hypothetical protein
MTRIEGQAARVRITLQDLLVVEDDQRLLQFAFSTDGVLMWPTVRSHLAHAALMDAYSLSNPFHYGPEITASNAMSYLINTLFRSPYSPGVGQKDILIFSSGITNILREGAYFNRLHDFFAGIYRSRTLIVEDSIRTRYLRPRLFPNVRYHDLLHILGRVRERTVGVSGRDRENIASFVQWLKEIYPYSFSSEVWRGVKQLLEAKAARLPILEDLYRRMFQTVQPKLVVVEDGSYGGRAHIFKWAKQYGAVTAEFQHGMISKAHPAFNYGMATETSPSYRPYLPDYVLTYGDYWSDRVNIPSAKIAMGNPNLTERVRMRESDSEEDGLLLIVSTGINPKRLTQVAADIAKRATSRIKRIVLRPHPSEAPEVTKRYGHLKHVGIRIDTGGDLFESLTRAQYVAGEVSTVLFEAAYLGKRVFLLDDAYSSLHLDDDTFPRFDSGDELLGMIQNSAAAKLEKPGDLFLLDWRQAYQTWVDETLDSDHV